MLCEKALTSYVLLIKNDYSIKTFLEYNNIYRYFYKSPYFIYTIYLYDKGLYNIWFGIN